MVKDCCGRLLKFDLAKLQHTLALEVIKLFCHGDVGTIGKVSMIPCMCTATLSLGQRVDD